MSEITAELHLRRSRWYRLALWFAVHWVVLRSFFPRFDEKAETERAIDFTMRFLTIEVRDAVAVR